MWCRICLISFAYAAASPMIMPSVQQIQFLGSQSLGQPDIEPLTQPVTSPSPYASQNYLRPPAVYSGRYLNSAYPAQTEIRQEIARSGVATASNLPPHMADQQPEAVVTPIENQQSVVNRIFSMAAPKDANGTPIDVDNLNSVMNRVGRELHFLSEKSRECLYDKVRSLTQLKRMREGLKSAYKDIYNLQFSLASYQEQLKSMQEYLKENRGRIVIVDNRQLDEMYNMVRRLQSAAETMVAGTMRSSKNV